MNQKLPLHIPTQIEISQINNRIRGVRRWRLRTQSVTATKAVPPVMDRCALTGHLRRKSKHSRGWQIEGNAPHHVKLIREALSFDQSVRAHDIRGSRRTVLGAACEKVRRTPTAGRVMTGTKKASAPTFGIRSHISQHAIIDCGKAETATRRHPYISHVF